ncbi:MAG: threonylcarbamoyl-AMP synthase [Acetobacteraceae bacterium]|nr:threonylcarbamoyl-AMP synthase [Acetobacteraceae bacterium]
MTEILSPDDPGLARAAVLLRSGALVAFGTETVYGLGADATNAEAVARIFAVKERPRFNPLICHYPCADAAFRDVTSNPMACRLAEVFWPGPLTLVLPRRPDCLVALLTGAGLDSLAVRVPAPPITQKVLRSVGRPIAAPSANRSGRVSPTSCAHVLEELGGRIDAILACGLCNLGIESTIIDLSRDAPVLLRPGGATREAIEAVLGMPLSTIVAGEKTLRSPGMLASHYAPGLAVRLGATAIAPDEALLAFGPPPPGASLVYSLSDSGDLLEAAARLFSGLRELDAEGTRLGLKAIAAMPVPEAGLGEAINDRLRRAAAPRA